MAKSGKGGGTRGAVHTVPSGSGWANKANGRTLSEHRTKANAEGAGRKQAIQRETEHVIHNRTGEIRRAEQLRERPAGTEGVVFA